MQLASSRLGLVLFKAFTDTEPDTVVLNLKLSITSYLN